MVSTAAVVTFPSKAITLLLRYLSYLIRTFPCIPDSSLTLYCLKILTTFIKCNKKFNRVLSKSY